MCNFQVEVKAVPIDKKELGECDPGRKMRRLSQPDPLTFGGHPPPPLHHSYEPTIRDKMCFHSVTIMKVVKKVVIFSFAKIQFSLSLIKITHLKN